MTTLRALPSEYFAQADERADIDDDVNNGKYDGLIELTSCWRERIHRTVYGLMKLILNNKATLAKFFPLITNFTATRSTSPNMSVRFCVYPVDSNGQYGPSAVSAEPIYIIVAIIETTCRTRYLEHRLMSRAVELNNPPEIVALCRQVYVPITKIELLASIVQYNAHSDSTLVLRHNGVEVVMGEMLEYIFTGDRGENIVITIYNTQWTIVIARISTTCPDGRVTTRYNTICAGQYLTMFTTYGKMALLNTIASVGHSSKDIEPELANILTPVTRTIRNNIVMHIELGYARAMMMRLRDRLYFGCQCDALRATSAQYENAYMELTESGNGIVQDYNALIGEPQARALLELKRAGYEKPRTINIKIVNDHIVEY